MEKRGLPISVGSRMEYVVLEHGQDPQARLGEKMEDPTYFMQHCDILRLDRLHYLKSVVPSMDQLFETAFKKKDVTKTIYQYHLQHFKVLQEWKLKNHAKLVFSKWSFAIHFLWIIFIKHDFDILFYNNIYLWKHESE